MHPGSRLPQLAIGNDICHIPRIYSLLTGGAGRRFIKRILTPNELQTHRVCSVLGCILTPNESTPIVSEQPRQPKLWRAAEFVAGRFAAKEAAIKAHPWRKLTFHAIEIARYDAEAGHGPARRTQFTEKSENEETSGPPVAVIKGEDETQQCSYASISISHDGDYAMAVCLANSKQ